MKNIVLRFGLISGGIVSTFMAISMIYFHNCTDGMDFSMSMVIGYLSMILAFSMMFVAVKSYRDKENGGMISFGKAFRISFLIAVIASTMYVVTWAVVYKTVMPDFMEVYTSKMMETAKNTLTETEFKLKVAEMQEFKEMYKNPIYFTLMTYSEILPVGLLVALITAVVLKRKQPVVQ